MPRRNRNLFTFFCLLLATNLAVAADSQRHQRIDGMDIYFGVIPAQMTQSQRSNMHGGADNTEHRYHVLLALFDSKSGERISDASANASVARLGMTGETKVLEPMPGGVLSYGNYFVMHKPDYYRIGFEIQRAKGGDKTVAKFVYQRPRD